MGAEYSVADLMVASAFAFGPQMTPDDPAIRAWVDRCIDRPAQQTALEFDSLQMQPAD